MIVKVEKQACFAVPKEPIVSGTVGIRYAEFDFSDDWKGLDAMAVFQTSFGVGRVMEIIDNKCEIPWEVMEKAGNIKVGIIGVKGNTRYPTIWSQPVPVIQGTVANGGKSGIYTRAFLEQTLETARGYAQQAKAYLDEFDLSKGYVRPEDYGAKADGVTDDSDAIQAALDSGSKIILMNGDYATTKTIVIRGGEYDVWHSGRILYSGTGSAVRFENIVRRTRVRLGTIRADNGNCIEFYARYAAAQERVQYVDLEIGPLVANASTGKCIWFNIDVAPGSDQSTVGWLNEIHIYNGRCSGGAYGIYADAKGYQRCNSIKVYNTGLEGITTGIYLANNCQRWVFENLRYAESYTTLLETVGAVTSLSFNGSQQVNVSKLSLSSETNGVMRVPIFDNGVIIAGEQVINNGVLKNTRELATDAAYEVLRSVLVKETATGDVVAFADGADNVPVSGMVVELPPQQSGSGTPAADNHRPFVKWTQAKVYHFGKNLLPNKTVSISTNNRVIGSDENEFSIYLKAGVNYVISKDTDVACSVYANYNGGTAASILSSSSGTSSAVFTPSVTGLYKLWLYRSGGVAEEEINWFQLEVGSTFTGYAPYVEPIETTITVPETYGGSVDLQSGVYSRPYGYYSSYSGQSIPGVWWSDRDEYVEGNDPSTGAEVVYLKSSGWYYTDIGKIDMGRTHLGANTYYADSGSMSVTYSADTKMYVDNAIAALE